MRILILLFLCFHAQAQFSSSTTSKVDVIKNNATANVTLSPSGDVVLTPATVDTLIYADADKKLKSTTYSPNDVITQDPITNQVLINGYLNLVSTTQGSVSCPVMTEAQRDLIAVPATGECVFNSNSQSLNVYDGATWKSAGGGISQWVTGFNYSIDDIVVYVGEIYQALTAHTSGTFTTDLANGEWVKIADTVQSQGLKDSSSATYKNIAVPNKQATAIGSNTVLLENGNQNLLSNPSFEHQTYDTSWTCTGDSVESKETTIVIDGNASLETDATADTFECYQDTTLYQAQLASVQGQASVWIKTNDVTVQVCARQAGVTLTGQNCVTVNANNEWKEYVIPFVMGTTSNGISIAGTSGTGTTYIDNAYVGIMPANRTPEISQAQQVGTARLEGATNCTFSTTSTSYVGFAADADCGSQSVTGNLTAPTTKKLAFNYNFQAGRYVIRHNVGWIHATTAGVTTCKVVANSVSSTEWWHISRDSATTDSFEEMSFVLDMPSAFNGEAELQCKVSSGTLSAYMNSTAYFSQFSMEYYPPKSKVYSGSTIYPHAQLWGTVSYTGATNCTWGVTSTSFSNFAADADCSNPIATGKINAPSTKIPAFVLPSGSPVGTYKIVSRAGFGGGASGARVYSFRFSDGSLSSTSGLIYESNSIPFVNELSGQLTYTSAITSDKTINIQGAVSSGLVEIGAGFTNNGLTFEVYYFPPQDNPIIGTFAGIEKCEDDFECTDTFSAKVSSTGVVSDENLDWINGNCTYSAGSVCTFNAGIFTVAPNCWIANTTSGANQLNINGGQVYNLSSTGATFASIDAAGSFLVARNQTIYCQKQGSDYKPKTAKAATTNEMMYVPNVTRPKTCYYAFGGASATLSSPTECTTGTCVEVVDNCSTGTPPAYNAGVRYSDLTFANGTWKANSFIHCTCTAYDITASQDRQCIMEFGTGDGTWSTNANGGYVANITSTSVAGIGQTAYVSIECTADAP